MSSPPPSSNSNESPPNEELHRMPVWQHLDDLRRVLTRCLLIIGVGTIVTYHYSEIILRILEKPLFDVLPEGQKHLYFTGISDKFMTYLKVSIYSAIGFTSPLILWQVWGFVSPALYERERRFIGPLLFFATLAFVGGVLFGYFLVIPSGYKFLLEFGPDTERPLITLAEYFSLTVQILLVLGAVFELPVLMALLGKFGIVNHQLLSKVRPHAYVLLSIGAAVLTPTPDAFTMILVMLPLFALHELSIVLVKWIGKPPAA